MLRRRPLGLPSAPQPSARLNVSVPPRGYARAHVAVGSVRAALRIRTGNSIDVWIGCTHPTQQTGPTIQHGSISYNTDVACRTGFVLNVETAYTWKVIARNSVTSSRTCNPLVSEGDTTNVGQGVSGRGSSASPRATTSSGSRTSGLRVTGVGGELMYRIAPG